MCVCVCDVHMHVYQDDRITGPSVSKFNIYMYIIVNTPGNCLGHAIHTSTLTYSLMRTMQKHSLYMPLLFTYLVIFNFTF